TEPGERDEDVEAGDHDEGGDDRARHGLLRIFDLVTGGRYRIEPDEREEDHARRGRDACHALVPEAVEVVGVERGEGDYDEHPQHTELDQHHDCVDGGGFTGTANQQKHAHHDQEDGGQVDNARDVVPRGCCQRL